MGPWAGINASKYRGLGLSGYPAASFCVLVGLRSSFSLSLTLCLFLCLHDVSVCLCVSAHGRLGCLGCLFMCLRSSCCLSVSLCV